MGLLKTRYCRKKKKRKKEIAGIFVHCRVHCRAVMKELTLTFFLTAPAFTVTTVKKTAVHYTTGRPCDYYYVSIHFFTAHAATKKTSDLHDPFILQRTNSISSAGQYREVIGPGLC